MNPMMAPECSRKKIVMPVAEEPDAAQGLVGDGSTGVAAARQVVDDGDEIPDIAVGLFFTPFGQGVIPNFEKPGFCRGEDFSGQGNRDALWLSLARRWLPSGQNAIRPPPRPP